MIDYGDLIQIQEARTERTGTATFSDCGLYRYQLTRAWDSSLPRIYWLMLNPSTADSIKNDHTITKVVKFSQIAGFGEATILNLFAYRTPYPQKLFEAHENGIDVIGPENDKFIGEPISVGSPVVAAWGNHGCFLNRGTEILELFPQLLILDMTKQGQPAHPLRLPYKLPLRPL
jgi:hypothetical protein